MVERRQQFSHTRSGSTLGKITVVYSEKRVGLVSPDGLMAYDYRMKGLATERVCQGDVLSCSDGSRYKVGAVKQTGRCYLFELAKEA